MPSSSFYTDGETYDTAVVTSNDNPASTTPSQAPSSFYPEGNIYDALAEEGSVVAQMAALEQATQAAAASGATSATNASTSAAAALASQNAAATSASSASTSATNSGNSATAAATSASHAATSEANAAASATAASGSATAASGSASAASGSASTASTQAGNAATSATNAHTSELNAASSASAAAASASSMTPATAAPLVDGTAAVGVGTKYAREDHVHPTDTSRAALTQVVRYDAAQALTSAQQAQARANVGVEKKNYIINGAMMVSQQNGSAAGTVNSYFAVDQFYNQVFNTTATYSFQQVASVTPAGSPKRLRMTVTAADAAVGATDQAWIETPLEGLRTADLRLGTASPKTVTIQFGVKAPAGTYCVTTTNSAANRSYVAEYVIAAGEANTDVVKTVVIPCDTTGTWASDNTLSMRIRWGLMAGSSIQQTAGSWGTVNAAGSANQSNFMGTNGNVFELFDVGLYEGSVAPAFKVPDYASELLLCQRYWLKTYNYGTAPGTADTLGPLGAVSCGTVANRPWFNWMFPTRMRAVPSIVTYSDITGASGKAADRNTAADFSTSLFTSSESGAIINVVGTPALGDAFTMHAKADARL